MKSIIFILFILCANSLIIAQEDIEGTKFEAHQNLIGGIWKLDASWKDGTPHKLSIEYESALNGSILKTKTYGNIKEKGVEFGLRNEGIRYFNNDTGLNSFYEFDIFGTLTQGSITYISKNIYYTYEYISENTKTIITDGWEFIDSDTYTYSIGIYDFETNKWLQKFLTAQIKRMK